MERAWPARVMPLCASWRRGCHAAFSVSPAPAPGVTLAGRAPGGREGATTTPVTVSERDLRALLGIVGNSRADLPPQGLPLSLLAELKSQIPCDNVSFHGEDPGRREVWFDQTVGDHCCGGDEQACWEHFWDSAACAYPYRTGDVRRVTKISDFYSARQRHSSAMYCDYARPAGIEHHLKLCLPAGPGRLVKLMFFRGPGPDFSERDRALLMLLRPHLHQAYLDAENRRAAPAQITARQRELLRLVAAAYTNAQIAHRLGVTEKTVGKHLENIYARLQVSNRTAAVTRAFPSHATGWPPA
jgi:DNA-binding CsgD family transcriptional regulator